MPPAKHHFIPEFYLREWTGDDGQLERYWLDGRGELTVKRLAPAAMAWERDLYRAPGPDSDPWRAQALERHFFGPIDANASKCMSRLNSGDIHNWSSADRTTWAVFLLSLFHRTPEHLEATKRRLREIYQTIFSKSGPKYEDVDTINSVLDFNMLNKDIDPLQLERAAFRLLPSTIDNQVVGQFIINVQWGVVNVQKSDYPFIISDNPIIFRPLKESMGHIAIPISPYRLFVAAQDPAMFAHLMKEGPKQVVRTANHVVVGNANTFVGAVNRDSHAYIKKNFGTRRLGSVANGFARSFQ